MISERTTIGVTLVMQKVENLEKTNTETLRLA